MDQQTNAINVQIYEEALRYLSTIQRNGRADIPNLNMENIETFMQQIHNARPTDVNRAPGAHRNSRNSANIRQSSRHSQNNTRPTTHPQFKSKQVCTLYCKHCSLTLCHRGMKASLLGDSQVELFSTDIPPEGVQQVYGDYRVHSCSCRIKDAACLGCGNVVGYHVTQPCNKCMQSCNNGILLLFKLIQRSFLDVFV